MFTGRLEEARFPDGAFDAVSLWDVIEHLDRPLDLLRESQRILSSNGVLLVFTINQRSLINEVGDLLHRLTLGWVRCRFISGDTIFTTISSSTRKQ